MEKDTKTKVQFIVLFAILFAVFGWTLPPIYASVAPANQFIEVHDFQADDAHEDAVSHQVCFDRTIKSGTTGKVFLELYMRNSSTGERIEIETEQFKDYFQQGRAEVVRPYKLPEEIEPGEYRYEVVITLDVSNNRIQRSFAYQSNNFTITEQGSNESIHRQRCV